MDGISRRGFSESFPSRGREKPVGQDGARLAAGWAVTGCRHRMERGDGGGPPPDAADGGGDRVGGACEVPPARDAAAALLAPSHSEAAVPDTTCMHDINSLKASYPEIYGSI